MKTITQIMIAIALVLSFSGEAKAEMYWCVAHLDIFGTTKNVEAREMKGQHIQIFGEAQKADLLAKKVAGSEKCPDGYNWEELPLLQRPKHTGAGQAAGATQDEKIEYYTPGNTTTVRIKGGTKETRTGDQMVAELQHLPASLGGSKAGFAKSHPGAQAVLMWAPMVLKSTMRQYPALVGIQDVKNRLDALLNETGNTLARIYTESSGNPYSFNGVPAIGLTQIVPSTVADHCPGQSLADPYVQISCGMAEALDKSNKYRGNAVYAQIAYVAGPARLEAYIKAAGKDPDAILAYLAKGGSYAGRADSTLNEKERKAKASMMNIPRYVNRNISGLSREYVKNREWFKRLLQMPEFKPLWNDLQGELPEYGIAKS